jgi:hypothetical protein
MGVRFGACYLPAGGLFGVNPNIFAKSGEGKETLWLLSYINSSLVSYIVRKGIIRTNMITSGYASRIPLPEMSNRVREQLAEIAREGIEAGRSWGHEERIARIDAVVFEELGISEAGREEIVDFAKRIVELT